MLTLKAIGLALAWLLAVALVVGLIFWGAVTIGAWTLVIAGVVMLVGLTFIIREGLQ